MYNSNKPRTKTVSLPGRFRHERCANLNSGFVEPTPPGEDKVPWRMTSHPRIIIFFIHLNVQQTKVRERCLPRVNTPTHDVETPTRGWWSERHLGTRSSHSWILNPSIRLPCWGRTRSQRHTGRIRAHAQIRNPSVHLQLQHTRDESNAPSGHRPTRCGNLNASG